MGLETGSYINDLVSTNPLVTDPKSQGDDHLRLIKTALLDSFAGWPGFVLVTGTEAQGTTVNDFVVTITPAPAAYTTGVVLFKATHTCTGACTLKINSLTTKTFKDLDGGALGAGDIVSGAVCLTYFDGTDFFLLSGNDKSYRTGDTYSGTHDFTSAVINAITQSAGDNSTAVATTAYADNVIVNGTNATSTTSLALGLGTKNLTIQTGKSIVVGMSCVIAYTTTPTIRMSGTVLSYNSGTGALSVSVDKFNGSGTYTTWTISLGIIDPTVITEVKGADIASVATVDLDAATGNFVHITGTTTITTITLSSGAERTVVFDGALTLTHNATTLILPGGANITTAAGDRAIFRGDGSGNTRCIAYTRADGLPVVSPASGGMVLLSSVSASNSATVDIETTFDSTYDAYELVITGLRVTGSADALRCLFKIGGSYDTGANYRFRNLYAKWSTSTTIDSIKSTAANYIELSDTLRSTSGNHYQCTIRVHNVHSTSQTKSIYWTGSMTDSSNTDGDFIFGSGGNTSTSALTGLRFQMSSGNISEGSFRLYGIKNS